MSKVVIAGSWAIIVVLSIGCATKSYVRKQVKPILDKVNDLDQRAAENSKDIKEVDARAQEGIQAASASNQEFEQKIAAADNVWQQANQLASVANNKCTSLVNIVSNLDNYHSVTQTLVVFSFNDARLGAEAQQELDQLGEQLAAGKGYIVVVKGAPTIQATKNTEVVRYLASKYDVPAYRVHTIAVGPEKPVASDNTADGRKKNRRAVVQVISNTGTQPASKDTSDDEDEVSQARLAMH